MTAFHSTVHVDLVFALGAGLTLNCAIIVAIVIAKLLREHREAAIAALRAELTEHLIDVLNSDDPFSLNGRRVRIGDRALLLPPASTSAGRAAIETALSFIVTVKGEGRERMTRILESSGYVDATVRRLKSRSELQRADAASILGGMGSSRAIVGLTDRFLHDTSQEVRIVAAEALGSLRYVPGIPGALLFLQAAREPTRYQEVRIATVLAKFGSSVVGPLEDALADSEIRVVMFALDVLIDIGEVLNSQKVIEATTHRSRQVRGRAIDLMGAARQTTAFRPVLDALSDTEWFVRLSAVKALYALSVPDDMIDKADYFAALEYALHDERWAVRRNAAATLGGSGDEGRKILQRVLTSECLAALQINSLRQGRFVPTVT